MTRFFTHKDSQFKQLVTLAVTREVTISGYLTHHELLVTEERVVGQNRYLRKYKFTDTSARQVVLNSQKEAEEWVDTNQPDSITKEILANLGFG